MELLLKAFMADLPLVCAPHLQDKQLSFQNSWGRLRSYQLHPDSILLVTPQQCAIHCSQSTQTVLVFQLSLLLWWAWQWTWFTFPGTFQLNILKSLKFKMPLIWNFTVSIIPVLRRFWGLDFFHQRWLFCVCNLEVTLCVYERIVWFILQIWCHFMRPDHCEFGICEMVTIPADPETACFSCLFRLYKERKHWNLWEILRRFPLTWLFLPWQ